MKHLIPLTLIIFTLALTACAGQAGPEPAAPSNIDVANLPADVDVKTAAAVQDNPDVVMIDVREQWEYDEGHIPGITLIPMGEVTNRLDEIPKDKTVILTCRSGNRSGQVTDFLRNNGFDNVHNMTGGIVAWENAGLAVEQ
ncbi:MAG TPA: rhodanese-like domain-containing protein [Anaerolineae bacterium]|nr:rhodanese-like domain-containing protein [Anaerolineae bacterium]HRV90665.1 rhodanese-like domain-containing protein [Anaerolineae bacterium]